MEEFCRALIGWLPGLLSLFVTAHQYVDGVWAGRGRGGEAGALSLIEARAEAEPTNRSLFVNSDPEESVCVVWCVARGVGLA